VLIPSQVKAKVREKKPYDLLSNLFRSFTV